MNILMLLSNPFRPDPRVAREASVLVRAGHQVSILCWDRKGEFSQKDEYAGARIMRVQNIRTVYGAGMRQIIHLPRFWQEAIRIGVGIKPDVVHAHDLDTLFAGVQIKKRTGCRLVYDAHEDYPAMMSLYLPGLAISALRALENAWLRHTDQVICASTIFAERLAHRGIAHTVTVGNFQDLTPYTSLENSAIQAERTKLGIPQDAFVVAYIGGFTRNRLLVPLMEAVREVEDVTLLICGDGHQRDEVQSAADSQANICYPGWIPASQVPIYTKLADVIYYCLRPDYPGAEYNAPNSLSNAMAAGRPIIANRVGDLGRIVETTQCGILLEDVSPAAILAAIQRLRDPGVRRQLGENGLHAAQTQYNWETAGKILTDIYQQFTTAAKP